MKISQTILSLLMLVASSNLFAGNPKSVNPFTRQHNWNFVENKGQIPDGRDAMHPVSTNSNIKYYGHTGGVYLFCKPGEISFVFTKIEKEPGQISEATNRRVETGCIPSLPMRQQPVPTTITTNRADFVLLNSNPNAQIIASDQQKYYENYYTTGNADSGITNVHTYKTITYKDIYPHIDMVLHASPASTEAIAGQEGMKYEFVVYPGGRVSDIQIQWHGLQGMEMRKDGGISYCLACGSKDKPRFFGEGKPMSYQGDTRIGSAFLKCEKNAGIGFRLAHYDKTKVLVIDPTLVWGTYFGGAEADFGTGVATDADGNVFITGGTNSLSGIATNGAFQTINNESAFLAKFSNSGHILWATYFGDSCNSTKMATDGSGNVFITGSTVGKAGIATSGAYQTSFLGPISRYADMDAFLAKFDSNGFRKWSTYYGGSGGVNSNGYGIATDLQGNVYITGETTSNKSIATSGAYQTNSGSSNNFTAQDAFLAKFNGNGVIQWGTYYGYAGSPIGSKFGTTGYSVAADRFGNIYMAGTTGDASGIATSGAYQTSYSILSSFPIEGNGFLAKFKSNGSIEWATYYGDSFTSISGVAIDFSGNAYITGETEDTAIATPGTYQTAFAKGTNAFLTKFNSKGAKIWGTFLGGNKGAAASAVATDGFESVYIIGTTNSSTGIATNGAYQSAYNPTSIIYSDAVFLAKFNSKGSRLWASYFGKDSFDIKGDLSADDSGNVYLTTGPFISDSGFASPWAYQTYYGGNGDAFLAKLNIKERTDAGISSILPPNVGLCPGLQSLKVQLHNYGLEVLDSATIGWSVDGKPQPSYHWVGKLVADSSLAVTLPGGVFITGQDTVKAWTTLPNGIEDSIQGNDTFSKIVTVNPLPIANVGQGSYQICTGTHIKIGANAAPRFAYSWTSVPAGFSSSLPNPVVAPDSNTVYYLSVTDSASGCSNKNSADITVSILKAPVIDVGKNQTVCYGDSAQIGSSTLKGDKYLWTSNPTGFASTVSNPIVTPNQSTSYLLTVTSTQGCTNFDSVTVIVNSRPVVATGTPLSLCAGLVIPLGGPPTAGYTYSWTSKPIGFVSTLSDPIDSPMVSTEYFLKETITATGCTDSGNISFQVYPQPAVPVVTISPIGGFEYGFILKNPDSSSVYSWSFGDSSPLLHTSYNDSTLTHIYPGNGSYRLAVSALDGHCEAWKYENINLNEAFSLNIYPNPFDLQTDINYTLIQSAHVRITMTDEIGRQIGTLVDQQQNPGEYNLVFDGAAWKARPGMYFVVFQLDDKVIVKKIVQLDSDFN